MYVSQSIGTTARFLAGIASGPRVLCPSKVVDLDTAADRLSHTMAEHQHRAVMLRCFTESTHIAAQVPGVAR